MPSGPQGGQEVILSTDGLVSIENVRGSAFADYIVGNQEDNIIDGRGSADQMFGATGNDTYFVDNANDGVAESAGAGTLDIVRASVSYELAAGSEVEVLETTSQAGTAAINLTGNEFANTINGNNGANTLNGGGGVNGDTLSGFGGNDTYIVDTQQDTVIEGQGQGTNDRVQTSATYALAAGCEIETLETTDPSGTGAFTLIGNEFDNSIVGNDGINVIVGGDGRDTLTGRGDIDAFLWSSIDDTGLNIFDADIVTDYSSAEGDVLHFTNMDADETVAGDQNFTFISTAAFTAPGQINWFSNGTNTFIQLNTDADLTADGIIQLNGVPSGDAVLMFL
jgi:Ca2+-binding RTX toxin-like protein